LEERKQLRNNLSNSLPQNWREQALQAYENCVLSNSQFHFVQRVYVGRNEHTEPTERNEISQLSFDSPPDQPPITILTDSLFKYLLIFFCSKWCIDYEKEFPFFLFFFFIVNICDYTIYSLPK
jgi:hypothetical protein